MLTLVALHRVTAQVTSCYIGLEGSLQLGLAVILL